MNTLNVTQKTRCLEVLAVVVTALGKFVFMDYLNWRFPYVAFAVLTWTVYIFYRKRKTPGILKHWGFRTDNLRQTLRWVLPFGIFSVLVFVGIGLWQGSLNLTWHIFPILFSYPIWGTIQQFLLIAIVVGNMRDIGAFGGNDLQIILSAACLFSVVHYPSIWLMVGTFLLALFYGFVFLKERNVYVLGLFHGWLGAIFYYTVVGTDPFEDAFISLLG